MRVYGEAFLFINGWMDFLCLLIAARLGKSRFQAGKALISACLGGVYGMLAWSAGGAFLRSVPILLLACALLALSAFGRRGIRLFPLVLLAGWLLSGLSDFVMARGAPPAAVIWINGAAALALCLPTRTLAANGGRCVLRISYRGSAALIPALPDTGNLLADRLTGLPVIVAPEQRMKALLPPGTNLRDLGTLPPGWRLMRVKTAAGCRALMCFLPDRIEIKSGGRAIRTEALIALSDFEESRALVPGCLMNEQREEMCHAVL